MDNLLMQIMNSKGQLLGWYFGYISSNTPFTKVSDETKPVAVDSWTPGLSIQFHELTTVQIPFQKGSRCWHETCLVSDEIPAWFWERQDTVKFSGELKNVTY
jgi:hypothetical protein